MSISCKREISEHACVPKIGLRLKLGQFEEGLNLEKVCVPKNAFRLKLENIVYLKSGSTLTSKKCVPKIWFRLKLGKFEEGFT